MGDLLIPMPEIQSVTLLPEHEFLILASDGLWDVISSKEAVAYVRYMHSSVLHCTTLHNDVVQYLAGLALLC
jgi:serine/threonine protein phosphatase PrpC